MKTESSEMKTTFWTWFNGGYNMPSEKKIDRAKGWEEEKVSQPTFGFWDWICGGYNIPSDKIVLKTPLKLKESGPPTGFIAYLSGGYNVPVIKERKRR